jgi:uncharacterized protein YbjT (DUF2867 family)
MTIAMTAPTGRVGSRVLRLLLQAGARPVVLLRDPSRLGPETRALVDIRQGDQDDPDFVVAATKDTDALFWLDPTDFMAEDPNEVTVRLGGHAPARSRPTASAAWCSRAASAPRSGTAPG